MDQSTTFVLDFSRQVVHAKADTLIEKIKEKLEFNPNYAHASGRWSISHLEDWEVEVSVKIRRRGAE